MEFMGYVDENLITDEVVAYRAQLHWILLVKPLLAALFIAVAAALVFYLALSRSAEWSGPLEWIGVGLLVIASITLIAAWLKRSSAEFAVTNRRVILKTGFIQKRTEEMFLNKIESVGVDQSFGGRLLGYGTIQIRGTGGSLEPFDQVSAPLEFRRQIQEQIGKTFGPASRPAGAGA